MMKCFPAILVAGFLGSLLGGWSGSTQAAEKPAPATAPAAVWERLAQGEKVQLVVVFDDSAIKAEAEKKKQRGMEEDALQHWRQARLAALKKQVLSRMPARQVDVLNRYDALPMMFLQFRSARGLKALLAQKTIINVYEDQQVHLAQ